MRFGRTKGLVAGVVFVFMVLTAEAQTGNVTVRLSSVTTQDKKSRANLREAVAWLVPVGKPVEATELRVGRARLVQKGKQFHPHMLILPAGSSVEFPNEDPLFHNVFSLFNGKRFDLGLYEAGESRTVRFDRVGVSYIFCNIHPQMSAIIVTVDTPYYGTSNADGVINMAKVPTGEYELHVFAEGLSSEDQKALTKRITVAANDVIASVALPDRETNLAHKNKYGRDYDPVSSDPYEK
jgi:plastocyanin